MFFYPVVIPRPVTRLTGLLCFLTVSFWLPAQVVYPIDEINSVNTCSGIFTDAGGANDDHPAGTTDTITICSGSAAADATHIRLSFTSLDISGPFAVYNGPAATPDRLVNTLQPFANGTNPVIQATAANPSGCLTLVYSAGAATGGWTAAISCVRACQPVIAELTASEPVVAPADTGTVDLCPGDTLFLRGNGSYPENGAIYPQSDETSTFTWFFGDGASATGSSAAHAYANPGGYRVQLRITDQNGCENVNALDLKVRVAPRPSFLSPLATPGQICTDEVLLLKGTTQFENLPDANVRVTTEPQAFAARQRLSDTTFLADGTGVSYSTSLEFSDFNPGQTLQSADDLRAVCLNMEHSFVGDLDISLECPSGQRVDFIRFGSLLLTAQFLGQPVLLDDTAPGVGFDYCWTNSATQTMPRAVLNEPVFPGQSMPAGDYQPLDSFDDLIGCPLNGEWTIHVTDNITRDNGYIFGWGIEFADNILPRRDTFTVGFMESFWLPADDLVLFTEDSIAVRPSAAGLMDFTYTVTDDFGCSYDTTLFVEALPFSHPDCYNCLPLLDTNFRRVDTIAGVNLRAGLATAEQLDTLISFKSGSEGSFLVGDHLTPATGFRSVISTNSIFPETIAEVGQIGSVCVNLITEPAAAVDLFLLTPDGQTFELSTGNGGPGADYQGGCFTPLATRSIIESTPPYDGMFLPEGDWSELTGQVTEGNWSLLVVSRGDPTARIFLQDWNISFHHRIPLAYEWTPDDGNLSCTDCPDPVVTVGNGNQTYRVEVTDSYGCSEEGSFSVITQIVVDLDLEASDVSCAGGTDGTARVVATNGLPPYEYAWSNGSTDSLITALTAGVYRVTVTDVGGNSAVDSVTVGSPPALELNADLIQVDCFGDATGRISLLASGGTGDYRYLWSDGDTVAIRENLGSGEYIVTLTDANACELTENYRLSSPDALVLDLAAEDLDCNNALTGNIDLTVSGGSPPYSYAWSNGRTNQDIDELSAGTYRVVVTDSLGCVATDSVVVNEPPELSFTVESVAINCHGGENGSIALLPAGGTPPYQIDWNNGETSAVLAGLGGGNYAATVTDARGCSLTAGPFELIEPEPLECSIEIVSEPTDENPGTLRASATGGTPPYQFRWDDSNATETAELTDLPAGTYTVTITDDNGCVVRCAVRIPINGRIGDRIFNDKNRDGIQDMDEPGLSGLPVKLLSEAGVMIDSTVSDADGSYRFYAPPGTYRLRFRQPQAWLASPMDRGDDTRDSDIDTVSLTTAPVTIDTAGRTDDVDAGFYDPCYPGLTFAGVIGVDQEVCGPGNQPGIIEEISPPEGEMTGSLNYLWLKTHRNPETTPLNHWSPIPHSDVRDYQPGALMETTYFIRCVRIDNCPYWESNIVTVKVNDDAHAAFTGPSLVCERETVTFTATGLDEEISVEWEISGGADFLGFTDQSVTLLWQSFGHKIVTLLVTQNGCTARLTKSVNVIDNPDYCSGNPGGKEEMDFGGGGTSSRISPNPTGDGSFAVDLLSGYDEDAPLTLEIYATTGQRIYTRRFEATGLRAAVTDFRPATPGLYLVRLRQGGRDEVHRLLVQD